MLGRSASPRYQEYVLPALGRERETGIRAARPFLTGSYAAITAAFAGTAFGKGDPLLPLADEAPEDVA
jgi:hypothetical protein